MGLLACDDLGDELEHQMLRLEADSIEDDDFLLDGSAASKWLSEGPDLTMLAGQDPFATCIGSAPLQGGLLGDVLDPSLWGGQPPAASLLTDTELDELTRASRRALITAAKKNSLSVSMYGLPVQNGSWQGCAQSPWCNAAENHTGPCNAKATIPGVAAYASLLEAMNEVDDKGSILDACDATAHGQAESSAAGSGKHGSSNTHHGVEEGENSSPPGCTDAPSKWLVRTAPADSGLTRSLSAGNIPGTARAPVHAFVPTKMELEVDAGLPAGWMHAHTSNHPLSNHCPGATNIELLEEPEEATCQQPTVAAQPLDMQPMGEARMADMSSINASWQPQGGLVGPVGAAAAAGAAALPSSFMIVNNESPCWTDTSSGLSGHQDGPSVGTWSTATTHDNSHNNGGGSGGQEGGAAGQEDAVGRRSLRATRSVPNFRSMALGGGVAPAVAEPPAAAALAPPPPSGGGSASGAASGPVRRVIIHRWPSSNSGPSLARKSRAAEELARSGATYASKPAGGFLSVAAPAPCHSSVNSLVDLGSPHSSGPTSTLTAGPQRPASGDGGEEDRKRSGSGLPPPPAKHHHNLRGRTHNVSAAVLENGGVQEGSGGGSWLQQQCAMAGLAPPAPLGHHGEMTGHNGLRTSRLPEVPPPQTHGGKKRGASGGPGSTCARPVPHPCGHCCTACGTSVTPVWRAGPQGPKTLCNACGVRYMKVAKKK